MSVPARSAPARSSSLRSWLSRVIGIGLAVGLLWLALRGVDATALGSVFARADLRWAVPLVAAALLSHLVRAWRWRLLLAALPEAQDTPVAAVPTEATTRPAMARVPTLWETFAAVMMGYAVNYALPRAGEVVRTATVSRRTGLALSSVLGTVVLDRLLDMAMLVLCLATLPLVMRDRLGPMAAMFVHPLRDRLAASPALVIALVTAALAGLAALVWLWRRSSGASSRLGGLMAGFRDGLATLGRSPHRAALVGATLVMWGLYLAMAYLPFLMLQQAAPYGLSVADGWAIMLLGSLGMVVPAPGGAGSFHYVTIETLTRLWGVARADAAAYAVLAHGAQLVVYVLAGALCFVLLGARRGVAPQAADPSPHSRASLDRA